MSPEPQCLLILIPLLHSRLQLVLIHHWHFGLHDMERCKLAATKGTQRQLLCIKFQNLFEHLIEVDPRIRACYHKILDFSDETLALDDGHLLAYVSRNEQSTVSCVNIRAGDSSLVADMSRLLYTLTSFVTNFVQL